MKTGRDFLPRSIVATWCGPLAALILAFAGGSSLAASATAPVGHPNPAKAQDAEPDPVSRNVVARARMLECGHQWSNMKKTGTASGTWKDFSRGCLAQR